MITMLEIIHVASGVLILSVQLLPLLRCHLFDQLADVLHHELPFTELPRGHHSATLAGEVSHLKSKYFMCTLWQEGDETASLQIRLPATLLPLGTGLCSPCRVASLLTRLSWTSSRCGAPGRNPSACGRA